MKAKVCLVSVTPDAEKTIGYIARVSNPANQDNPKVAGLLKYCIKHGHWSVFEQASMTLQIETTRGLAAQILRHRSFCFQEFSQRYADSSELGDIQLPELRRQDTKNRQNSIDDLDPEKTQVYYRRISHLFEESLDLYREMVSSGVAKETARDILPLATPSRLYMSGTLRSWIHYIDLRSQNGTQLEHVKIALEAKKIFCKEFPMIGKALEWL